MKSQFDMTRFASPAYGKEVRLIKYGLAQTSADTSVFNDLVKSITDALKDLPPETLGAYQDRLKNCQGMLGDGKDLVKLGLASECLRKLYLDIKNQKPVPQPGAPSATPFPWVPVIAAGLGVIGLITVLVVTRKK